MSLSATIATKIAQLLAVNVQQVEAAIQLLDSGATVPFISRYRKEITGGLTDTHLRDLQERLNYLRELEDRKQTILKSITEQNKLTPELEKSIVSTDSKAELEDIYLPYKPKRRTKAQIAKEAGLEPLAMQLLADSTQNPEETASAFINPDMQVLTAADALEGARHILIELFSEDAALLSEFRAFVWEHGVVTSKVNKGKEVTGNKFTDYFAYEEPIKKIPSHRALALLRGQRDEILSIDITLKPEHNDYCIQKILQKFQIRDLQRPADQWLITAADWAWRIRLFIKFEIELMSQLRENAEVDAINVFANNLKHLLMAAPAGAQVTLGLDPGLRTGVKTVVIDKTGKLLDHTVIYPHQPQNEWDKSITILAGLCKKHNVELVSIGNGTASRETDKLVAELKKRHPEFKLNSIVVSEAGASVYSASEFAAQEFPTLDVSYRGAVSIARRLQDPLAELVKIEPKSIGVGQYQHDVNQVKLSRTLRAVMEDCVNAVGVDVNTASIPLLACVAGLNESVAKNIVAYRDQRGAFKNRSQLRDVPRLGDKSYEQAAGFLRIVNGDNPLDSSAVHPEAYPVVEKILQRTSKPIREVLGNTRLLTSLKPAEFTDTMFGLPTVNDILRELEKPGRDPRPEFQTANFKEGIETLQDLSSGMILEGVITNVANFGAFVDIGVHQDGLVHISMLADRFVKDPNEIVKVGDIVKVKVIEVDIQRKRIQLTMRLNDTPAAASKQSVTTRHEKPQAKHKQSQAAPTTMGNALLEALNNAK